MATEAILIKFFVILSVLFFLPKVINRFTKLPNPITEVMLGIILGISLPSFFFIDDMLRVLSMLGIITLFVFSGMDVDLSFIFKNKRFFFWNIILHISLILITGFVAMFALHLSFQVSLLVSLALTTPSASYIISSVSGADSKVKSWITGKAIVGEILALLLMVIIMRITRPGMLALTILVIILLVVLLPVIMRYLYRVLFSKLMGAEFSFIFVIAIISAFITELLGIHFLIGAFVAGIVARRFIADIVKDTRYLHISESKGDQLVVSFEFFALLFAPFYFFTIGLNIKSDMFSWNVLIAVGIIGIVLTALRLGILSFHRLTKINEKLRTSVHISASVLPTLVFTFVIADILVKQYGLSSFLFSVLTLYGILTAILSIILVKIATNGDS